VARFVSERWPASRRYAGPLQRRNGGPLRVGIPGPLPSEFAHFACDTAWIDYINRGSVFDGKTTVPTTWLESAVLEHGNTGWKIRFFHSTRVPAAQPAK